MVGKYGDFYAAKKFGFPKAVAAEHAPSPQQFMPDHINDPSFYAKGWHKEELGDGFYWVTTPSGYESAFMLTGEGVIVIDAPPAAGREHLRRDRVGHRRPGHPPDLQPLALRPHRRRVDVRPQGEDHRP